ncbi:hypothetical protein AB3N02_22295 [Priestia aryabhattai]|uniref:hypothetical protein n=1 Tax=Priestia aryabhattai TaxID=412384 RepID=UPI0039A23AAC
MYEHFNNIKNLYGNASVRLPNGIFKDLSQNIKNKNGSTNIQQVAFAYVYLVTIAILYKYAHFVDVDNGTYIQNSDIKELLGYNRKTKSIDQVIKKNGVLDELGLTASTKDYPIQFFTHPEDKINNILLREFVTVSDINPNYINYNKIKKTVKNRNYEIKEPMFLTTEYAGSDYGTLYSIERTHQITINEFLKLVFDDEMDNIDFLLYGYFKAKCKGYEDDMKQLSLLKIISEVGMDRSTFYKHLDILKQKQYINVNHKGWKANKSDIELNEYFWMGIG